jgi:hypothetical protein
MYPFGPLPGCAVMSALVSHVDTCCIGVNCDAAAVTDVDLFVDCLRGGLAEVLSLAPLSSGRSRAHGRGASPLPPPPCDGPEEATR